ncbi:MAG TPA: dTMP kinase [Verrucomicrobiae bacterium]|nr:dTMP kinase [Verrucomicrobiae bacterium]
MNMQKGPGFLIAIEGIDGAGKTTQAHFVQERLQSRQLPVIRTKEPTMGRWGQTLRDSALTGRLSLDEEVEAFLNDRREHVEQVILPELKAGKIVILDRYYFSTVAYQGARGINPEELIRRNEEFAPEPGLLIILDIDPKLGLERIRMRGDRANHFEKTGTLKKAREIFRSINKPYLYRIDAAQPVETLRDLIVRQFSAMSAERIAQSDAHPQDKLNATLKLFGGNPS